MASELAVAHRRVVTSTQRRVAGAVRRAWDALDGDVSDAAVGRFVVQVRPIVQAAGATVASSADAYLTAFLRAQGVDTRPVGLRVPYPRVGVDIDDVYTRPFTTARVARSEGAGWPDALSRGLARAVQAAVTDVNLFDRDASAARLGREPRVVGYRRVLGSGGSSGRNCGLCIVASTQRYRKAQLNPIHPSCGCGVEPIVATADPGRVLDRGRLEYVAEAADARTRAALSRFRADADRGLPAVKVVDHGELGPVLYDANWQFTAIAA